MTPTPSCGGTKKSQCCREGKHAEFDVFHPCPGCKDCKPVCGGTKKLGNGLFEMTPESNGKLVPIPCPGCKDCSEPKDEPKYHPSIVTYPDGKPVPLVQGQEHILGTSCGNPNCKAPHTLPRPFPEPKDEKPSKNADKLASFTAYCQAHPEERFWQALRNWSPYNFIYGSKKPVAMTGDGNLEDTFYV